ncbi:GSCOCG00010699001-RA-CDS, partial [Cotesia congregata]
LFDASFCKCRDFEKCDCAEEKKIPIAQRLFLLDKRTTRLQKMFANQQTTFGAKNIGLKGIYFDGRKDYTSIQLKKGFKYFRQTIKEEHISLVSEPESEYIGHTTPTSGQANDIANGIYDFLLEKYPQSTKDINVNGCDGTAVNTGWKGGIVRRLGEKFNRPLQWVICLLHLNELPFKNLFQFIDDTTTGPNSYADVL